VSVRQPEPWESNAAAPFLTIDSPRGAVAVRALGQERFRVTAPDHDQEIVGFEAARSTAHEPGRRDQCHGVGASRASCTGPQGSRRPDGPSEPAKRHGGRRTSRSGVCSDGPAYGGGCGDERSARPANPTEPAQGEVDVGPPRGAPWHEASPRTPSHPGQASCSKGAKSTHGYCNSSRAVCG